MAAGVYDVTATEGWTAEGVVREEFVMDDDAREIRDGKPVDAIHISLTPSTGTLYGFVYTAGGDPIRDATVEVNGVIRETDIEGRFIVDGYGNDYKGQLSIRVSKDGYKPLINDPRGKPKIEGAPTFAANAPQIYRFNLVDVDTTATITGTILDADGDPVSGVAISVKDENDVNALDPASVTRGCNECQLTKSDGSYSLTVKVTGRDAYYTVTPEKRRMFFDPPYDRVRLESDDVEDEVDFEALEQGQIRGRVEDEDGNRLEGIRISATAGTETSGTATTNEYGNFTLWVDGHEVYAVTAADPRGVYTIAAPPDAARVYVDDGEVVRLRNPFAASTYAAGSITATRGQNDDGVHDGNYTVGWKAGSIPSETTVTYQVQYCTEATCGETDWQDEGGAGGQQSFSEPLTGTARDLTFTGPIPPGQGIEAFHVRVTSQRDSEPAISSDAVEVSEVDIKGTHAGDLKESLSRPH